MQVTAGNTARTGALQPLRRKRVQVRRVVAEQAPVRPTTLMTAVGCTMRKIDRLPAAVQDDGVTPPGPLPSAAHLQQLALAHRSSMVLFAASELDVFTEDSRRAHHRRRRSRPCATSSPSRCGMLLECVRRGRHAHVRRHALPEHADHRRLSREGTARVHRPRPEVRGGSVSGVGPAGRNRAHRAAGDSARDDARRGQGEDPRLHLRHARARPRHQLRCCRTTSISPAAAACSTSAAVLAPTRSSLVRQTPGLTSTVLDLPGVLEFTREIVAENGCADRIELVSGDYHSASVRLRLRRGAAFGHDAPGEAGDVPDAAEEDLRRDGGRRHGRRQRRVLRHDEKNSPPFATYFALNMMLMAEHGSAHAKTEMAAG